jgi:hypothetical protein
VRERVVAVGVPAAAADDLAFEYAPSVWEAREARRRDGRRDGVPSE